MSAFSVGEKAIIIHSQGDDVGKIVEIESLSVPDFWVAPNGQIYTVQNHGEDSVDCIIRSLSSPITVLATVNLSETNMVKVAFMVIPFRQRWLRKLPKVSEEEIRQLFAPQPKVEHKELEYVPIKKRSDQGRS